MPTIFFALLLICSSCAFTPAVYAAQQPWQRAPWHLMAAPSERSSSASAAGGGSGESACAPLPRGAVTGSVFKDAGGRWRFEEGVLHEAAVARATYVDAALTPSNFGKLRVATAAGAPDRDQAFAAGFAEGWLTAARIHDHHHNLRAYFTGTLNVSLGEPMAWIHEQDAWVRARVKESTAAAAAGHRKSGNGGGGKSGGGKGGVDDATYWAAVGLALRQWDGLVDGYLARAAAAARAGGADAEAVGALTREDLLFLHSNGDLYDVIDMLEAKAAAARSLKVLPRSARAGRVRWADLSPGALAQALATAGKCTAVVKVKEDLSEIFFGHSTWDNYMAMLRIFKHYELNYDLGLRGKSGGEGGGGSEGARVATRLSFSSYPGELFSDDDLYMTSNSLVVLETTNHIYNPDVYAKLTPRCVLSWQRVRAANLLAASGAEWVALFKRHNSGTYNNQYMVTDLNLFEPGRRLAPGAFHVVEQLPGLVEAADMTQLLAAGYWPSFNVAFFPRVYNLSGYPDFADAAVRKGAPYEQPAEWLKYQTAPRAKILRRDQAAAGAGLPAFKRLMRYNDWRRDPLSGGAPFAAVCGRGDLAPEGADFGPVLKGCYDSKVTTASMARRLEAEVVSGPTAQGQPPFEWAGRWASVEHRGMPERFDFQWEAQSPAQLPVEPGCGGAGAGGAAV